MKPLRLILSTCAALAFHSADAAVVRMEMLERSDLAGTDYEQISGRLFFEIDPLLPANAVIADVSLAPRNAAGHVTFSSDLRVLKPKDPARSNGAAWLEIPNRGGKASLGPWIVQNGFTIVNVGWEFDLPEKDKLRLEAPAAREPDGSPIRGVVSAVFTPNKPADEQPLDELKVYPPVNLAGPESRLLVRARAAYPAGREISRAAWRVEGNRLRLQGGFELGRTYELFWQTEAPPVAGLGYAAIRDAVEWLKHAPASPASVQQVYAFGSSQCGRFLRDYLYLGFNTDEHDRQAFDGVVAHIAGAGRLVLNTRWAMPRSLATYYTASYPFADTAQPDPVSGHSEGVLENARARHAPKIFYINTGCEYWGGGRVAALTHTDPSGTKDIAFPTNVRSYFFAGTQHGPASFPPDAVATGGPRANPVSSAPAVVALRMALHRWVKEGIEPPSSVYPKLGDGSLVPVAAVRLPPLPQMHPPNALSAGVRVPNPQWQDGAGAGAELPLLVPQVDADGIDLGGIRMPEVAVPLATATGWVFRPEAIGSPDELVPLKGAWIPFARTKAEREAAHDPRAAIEERYASKEAYLAKIREAAEALVAQRFLTEEDLHAQLQQASQRWDWIMSQTMK